jgi:ABC-2 type transport system permease protein
MIADIRTVMWKESKELLIKRGSPHGGLVGILVLVGIFGILLPWQMGRQWVGSPLVLMYSILIPLTMLMNVIADSFAGERERHTLETLLASRLSDRAILFGKVGAAMAYGWGATLLSLALGLITVNLTHASGRLLLYPTAIGLGAMGLSLLTAGFAAYVGVLASLRAATVRQAQQSLGIITLILIFVPLVGAHVLPAGVRVHILEWGKTAGMTRILLLAMAVLGILDVGLFAAAMVRFRRARLILD